MAIVFHQVYVVVSIAHCYISF